MAASSHWWRWLSSHRMYIYRLPDSLQRMYGRLMPEVEAREVSEGVRIHDTRHLQETSHTHKWDKCTASAMLTQDAGQNPSCIYCRDSHYSASCDKVTTVQSRREILRKEGRYFVCLMKGHRASECQSQGHP